MTRGALLLLLLAPLGALGCAGPRALSAQLAEVAQLAQAGRDHGAYRCAPEELALAMAHLEFAQLELAQGDPARAREHLVLADANARAAVRLSSEPECAHVAADALEACAPTFVVGPRAEAAPLLPRPSSARPPAHPRSMHGHVRS